ncbi:GDSL-type esterase/lipase family protein [Agriterribacter sp.]|uniref:GDSL-type esterase/lipase family protein n=1 Tax=Agriterribacter sp. TaxID=2821509 RepID=UPI002B52444E|nr:GDSL-type esterase/lipase family protein [Agriterribacter sp.]HRP58336.1 GDSL-type esterase/lipase family protein [Agriterribacter sp.]
MKIITRIITVLLIVFAATTTYAQQPPFYNDIQQFKKLDSAYFPPKKAVLFIGSSSFTFWKDVQEYFPGHTIINRGFGGSSLPDLIRYADDIVFAYDPKQVVIYCGENDLAASDTVSAATVAQRFITLFTMIRNKYPKIPVLYVSMKPSPSREHLMHKMDAGNWAIKEFLKKQKRTVFVDAYHLMLDAYGEPRKELFIEDMLHMNKNGYAIWQKAIGPYLK